MKISTQEMLLLYKTFVTGRLLISALMMAATTTMASSVTAGVAAMIVMAFVSAVFSGYLIFWKLSNSFFSCKVPGHQIFKILFHSIWAYFIFINPIHIN